MGIISFITNASDMKRILEHIGEPGETLPISPSRISLKEELVFDPENHPDVEFKFNQDVNPNDAFYFDQRAGDTDNTSR